MIQEVLGKLVRWLGGSKTDAQQKARRSLTPLSVGTVVNRPGHSQGGFEGVPAAGVAWPVEPETHDGASFIGSDAFFAYYDAKQKEVYCLDDIGGARHNGARPLRVGVNVEIANGDDRSGNGLVVRSAEYGTDGLDKNIFIHVDGDLIAHHRQPDPPTNSSQVHDPGEGPDDWAGGLHYAVRVRKFIDQFCKGTTASSFEPLFAPILNFTRNGDGTVAHGAAHFGKDEACLSHEAKGPLRPSSKKHTLGDTGDAKVKAGAIDTGAYFSDGSDGFTGPITFSPTPWVRGKRYLYDTYPELRYDAGRPHDFVCGPRTGQFDLWDSVPMTVYEPPPWKPKEPPPRQPRQPPPRDPEDDDDEPPTIIGPNHPEGLPEYPNPFPSHKPSAAVPHEVETPSEYAHPRPGIPDDLPPQRDADDGTRDGTWRSQLGFTEKEWMETPIVGHQDSMPVYENSTANENGDGPAGRWATTKTETEIVLYDQEGRVLGRHPALGPGSVIDMPSNMSAVNALKDKDATWPDQPNDHSRIIFSAQNTNGITADGRFGIGRRGYTSAFVVSGLELKLDFGGGGGATEPDAIYNIKDSEGADGTSAVHQFNQPIDFKNVPDASTTLTNLEHLRDVQTADAASTTTTMAATELSVSIAGSTRHMIRATFFIDSATAAGFKIDFGGGTIGLDDMKLLYTISDSVSGDVVDTGRVTSLTGVIQPSSNITGQYEVRVSGVIATNADVDPGTLIVRHARAGFGGTSTFQENSELEVVAV